MPDVPTSHPEQFYQGAPLLFPGMGHDLMLDARWAEPLDAILDRLEKNS